MDCGNSMADEYECLSWCLLNHAVAFALGVWVISDDVRKGLQIVLIQMISWYLPFVGARNWTPTGVTHCFFAALATSF